MEYLVLLCIKSCLQTGIIWFLTLFLPLAYLFLLRLPVLLRLVVLKLDILVLLQILEGNAFSPFPFSMMLVVGFSYITFVVLGFLLYLICWEFLSWRVLNFIECSFCIFWDPSQKIGFIGDMFFRRYKKFGERQGREVLKIIGIVLSIWYIFKMLVLSLPVVSRRECPS